MLRNRKLWMRSIALTMVLLFQIHSFAQGNKSFSFSDSDPNKDNVYMTWNKNTPESEMKEDIKALAEKGITIKYSNVKRNSQNEITAIRVEYSDRKGNKGNLEYNNQKAINTITFYKQGDEVGFGSPANAYGSINGNDFFNNFSDGQDFMKQFNLGNGGSDSQSFSYSFPDGTEQGSSKSKIIIKKDGKKPLVIEDGKIVEGGDDYTPEEIEKIKKDNKVDKYNFDNFKSFDNSFDFRSEEGLENFKKQMEKMQTDMEKNSPGKLNSSKSDLDTSKEEMLKAKEEMVKARKELEKARKDLEKTKGSSKTQKI